MTCFRSWRRLMRAVEGGGCVAILPSGLRTVAAYKHLETMGGSSQQEGQEKAKAAPRHEVDGRVSLCHEPTSALRECLRNVRWTCRHAC